MPVRDSSSGPLRVLCLINSLGPGGAERSLSELAPFFRTHGIELVVVCLRRKDTGVEAQLRSSGCEVRHLPSRGGFARRTIGLRRILAGEGFELLHTTLFEADVLGRVAAAGAGVPVLTSLVNTTYDPVRLEDPHVSRAGLHLARSVDGWTARHLTTHFHAITRAVRDSAVASLGIPPDRVTVVERGRDPVRLGKPSPERRARVRDALGLASDAEVVVNVARQEYQKGQRYLLEATALLAPRRPRLVVLIAGREGHATAELEGLHRSSSLGDRVRFLGVREDVPEILAAADIFVFPSLYEGLGGAVVEAMALGLPIVASDLPALREVVENGRNGLLVPSRRPESLAGAIEGLLADPCRASSFAVRSRQIFEDRFTLERSARRMVALYRATCGVDAATAPEGGPLATTPTTGDPGSEP